MVLASITFVLSMKRYFRHVAADAGTISVLPLANSTNVAKTVLMEFRVSVMVASL